MKSKTNKNKTSRAPHSQSRQKSAPKTSKVRDVGDKDLEQISGGLLRRDSSYIKIV